MTITGDLWPLHLLFQLKVLAAARIVLQSGGGGPLSTSLFLPTDATLVLSSVSLGGMFLPFSGSPFHIFAEALSFALSQIIPIGVPSMNCFAADSKVRKKE